SLIFIYNSIIDSLSDHYSEVKKANEYLYGLRLLKVGDLEVIKDYCNKENSTLLSYFEAKNNFYSFLIDDEKVKIFKTNKPDDFNDVISEYINNLKRYEDLRILTRKDSSQVNLKNLVTNSTNLFDLLWSQFKNDLNNQFDLIIVPDGVITYLPFETLLEGFPIDETNLSSFPYLIKKHAFSYSHSITELIIESNEEESEIINSSISFAPRITIKNDNIPLSESEKSSSYDTTLQNKGEKNKSSNVSDDELFIINMLNSGGGIVTDSLATTNNFVSKAPNHSMIHLSSLGFYNDYSPETTFVLFSSPPSSNQNSDTLFASNFLNTNFNSDLFVINTMELDPKSGIKNGSGLMYFWNSLKFSGVKSFSSTLWHVEGAMNLEFISNYYWYLEQGEKKSHALRNAKLDFIHSNQLEKSHPQSWAPYFIIGSNEPLPELLYSLVPTLGQWALIILSLIILNLGTISLFTKVNSKLDTSFSYYRFLFREFERRKAFLAVFYSGFIILGFIFAILSFNYQLKPWDPIGILFSIPLTANLIYIYLSFGQSHTEKVAVED
ncbi:MAG: CHAT domain-containing protein, partial [Bacteroidota bacterium]